MLSIQPNEIAVVGAWAEVNGKIEENAEARRIHFLLETELEKIATSNDGWMSLYRHKKLGSFWRLSYPHSEQHGGGAPRLDLVDPSSWAKVT